MGDKEEVFNNIFGSDSDDDDAQPEPPREAPVAASIPKGLGLSDSDEEDEEAAGGADAAQQPFKSSLEDGTFDSDDEALGDGEKGKREKSFTGPPLELAAPLEPHPGEFKLMKTSNILGVETKPFDPETHTSEELVKDEQGNVKVKLAHNIIRWRFVLDEAGKVQRQSNARVVRWSDGSQQLFLGDEVLEMTDQPCQVDHNYLYTRHQGFLQCLGQINNKLNYRPSSLHSKSHQKLTAIIDKQHHKVNKVKKAVVMMDPEREKEIQEKAAEERIRGREDLQRKQDRTLNRGGYGAAAYPHYPQQTLTRDYLEDEVEEEEDWGGAVQARGVGMSYEEEQEREQRILQAKREAVAAKKRPRDDSDGEDEMPSEGDSEEEDRREKTKRARNVILESDEED